MKNRKISLCLIIVLLVSSLLLCGFSEPAKNRIYDYADLYTGAEEVELQMLCMEAAIEIESDFVIVTTEDFEGKTATEYADDFYDYNGFGYGPDATGFVLVFNMEERELAVSNCGDAIDYFSDDMIDEMIYTIGRFLADEDFMGAAEWYVEYVEENMWSEQYEEVWNSYADDFEEEYGDIETDGYINEGSVEDFAMMLLIPTVIAAVVVVIIAFGHKSKMNVGSRTYMRNKQNNILARSDRFIRTTTVARKIESSSGGSGGSRGGSTHRSSSGRSHGGGSGRF